MVSLLRSTYSTSDEMWFICCYENFVVESQLLVIMLDEKYLLFAIPEDIDKYFVVLNCNWTQVQMHPIIYKSSITNSSIYNTIQLLETIIKE